MSNSQHPDHIPDELFIVAAYNAVTSLGWQVSYMAKQGIVATTPEGHDVKIVKIGKNISLAANGNDFDKNLEALKAAFEHAGAHLHPETAHNQYHVLSQSFKNGDLFLESAGNHLQGFLDFFIPSKRFFFTPLLIDINILIFIIMVISGIDFIKPDGASMVQWGASFKPLTLNGEWWRMFTSCFLHFGIMHLALNMYALAYIGMMLEPLVGKWRYLAAYLLSGVASGALSLYWNDIGVSAGASGAIFGMYGMFLATLLGNIIHKSLQKELFASIGVFVLLTLSFGFTESGVDNAGHVGGLVSGFIIGLIMIPGIKKPKAAALNLAGFIGALIIGLGSGWLAYTYSTDVFGQYDKLLDQFSKNEHAAMQSLEGVTNTDGDKIKAILKDSILPYWDKNKAISKQISALKLPEPLDKKAVLLQKYTNLRIANFNLLLKQAKEKTDAYNNAIERSNAELKAVLKEFNAPPPQSEKPNKPE